MASSESFRHHVPTPRGPYSPAVRAGDFIFVSGQGPIDPVTDKLSPGDIQHQTRLMLSNIQTDSRRLRRDAGGCREVLRVPEGRRASSHR